MAGGRTVRIEILGDAKGAKGAFGEVTASADSFASKLASVGKIAGAAIAGIGIAAGALAVTGIKAASDFEESWNKVGEVFDESAGQIQEWSKNAAQSFGLSRAEALGAAGTFGNLFVAMGIGGKQAADMSEDIVGLAADLGSFNNLGTEEVLEKIRAGLVGETEPLRSLGVNLDAASISAKAMAMGLADSEKNLTPAAKAQAAYALIVEQTTKAHGDFARTKSGMANSLKVIGASFDDIKVQIGQRLLPVVAPLISAFASQMPRALDLTGAALDWLTGLVKGPMLTAWTAARDGVMTFASALQGNWTDAKGIRTVHRVLGNLGLQIRSTITYVSNLIDAFRDGDWARIGTLIKDRLVDNFQSFSGLNRTILGWVMGAVRSIDWAGAAESIITDLNDAINATPGLVMDIVGWAQRSIRAINWTGIAAEVRSGLLDAWFAVTDWGGRVATWVSSTVGAIDIADAGRSIAGKIVDAWFAVTGWGGRAVSWVSSTISAIDFAEAGRAIAGKIVDAWLAVTDWGSRAVQWVTSTVGAIDFAEAGRTIAGKIVDAWFAVLDWGGRAVAWVSSTIAAIDFAEAGRTIAGKIGDAWFAVLDWGGRVVSWVSSTIAAIDFAEAGRTIAGKIEDAWFAVLDWGGRVVSWVGSAINSAGDWASAGLALKDRIVAAAQAQDWSGITTPIRNALNNMGVSTDTSWVTTLMEQLRPFVDMWSEDLAGIWSNLQTTWDGLTDAFSNVKGMDQTAQLLGTIAGLLGGAVVLAITGLLTWLDLMTAKWGDELVGAINGAITVIEAVSTVINTVIGVVSGMVSAVQGLIDDGWSGAWDRAKTAVSNAFNDMKTAVTTKVGEVVDEVAGLPQRAADGIGDLSGVLTSAGSDLIQGFINGITAKFDDVKNTLGGLTDKLTGWKGPEDVDRTLLVNAGRLVIQGFINGLESRYGDVHRSLASFTQSIKLSWDWLFGSIMADAKDYSSQVATAFEGLFGSISDLASGTSIKNAQAELDRLLTIRQIAIDTGAGEAAVAGIDAQIAEQQNRVQAIGAAMGTDIVRGITDQMQSADLAASLAESVSAAWSASLGNLDSILSGDRIGALQDTLRGLEQQLALALVGGAPEDVVAGIRANIAAVQRELGASQQIYDDAMNAGLIDTSVFQMPLDKISQLLPQMKDGGLSMIDELVRGVADGSASLGGAMATIQGIVAAGSDKLPETIGASVFEVMDVLKELDKSLTVDLAQALINGTDPSGIEANLAIVADMLGDLQAQADATAKSIKGVNAVTGQVIKPPSGRSADSGGSGFESAGGSGGGGTRIGGQTVLMMPDATPLLTWYAYESTQSEALWPVTG